MRDDLLEAATAPIPLIRSQASGRIFSRSPIDGGGAQLSGRRRALRVWRSINDQPPIVAVDDDGDGVTDAIAIRATATTARPRCRTAWNGYQRGGERFLRQQFRCAQHVNSLSQELQDPNVDPADPQVRAIFRTPLMWWTPPRITSTPDCVARRDAEHHVDVERCADHISTSNDELIGSLQDLDYGPRRSLLPDWK